MFLHLFGALFGLIVVVFSPQQSLAADGVIDEARFGGSWIDPAIGDSQRYYHYDRVGLNAELLFTPVNINVFGLLDEESSDLLQQMANPRFHIGGTFALEEHTTSSVYAGLTWHFPVIANIFIEGSFGGAIHDGKKATTPIPGPGRMVRRGLGSNLLFRESVSVGVDVAENINVILQLSHMSHAGLAGSSNAGQTDLALKVGLKF